MDSGHRHELKTNELVDLMTHFPQFLKNNANMIIGIALILIGLVTSLAVAGYKREIGVLRALGATRIKVTGLILAEGALLAIGGGITGFFIVTFAFLLFKNLIVRLTGLPSLFLQPMQLFLLATGILGLSLGSVILATLFPVLRTASREPGLTLKE